MRLHVARPVIGVEPPTLLPVCSFTQHRTLKRRLTPADLDWSASLRRYRRARFFVEREDSKCAP